METLQASQSLNPTPFLSLSQPLPVHNSTNTNSSTLAPLPDITLPPNSINSTNSTNSTDSLGDQLDLNENKSVYLWALVIIIPLMLFMLCLDCLECLPCHKKKPKSERDSRPAPFSSASPSPNSSSATEMNSRSTPEQTSERSSTVRVVAPGELELEARQVSLEQLELNLPGSRLSLSQPMERGAEDEEDDGQGPANAVRLQAM